MLGNAWEWVEDDYTETTAPVGSLLKNVFTHIPWKGHTWLLFWLFHSFVSAETSLSLKHDAGILGRPEKGLARRQLSR